MLKLIIPQESKFTISKVIVTSLLDWFHLLYLQPNLRLVVLSYTQLTTLNLGWIIIPFFILCTQLNY